MSVISYTLHKCTKYMHCLRICPTEAITIQNERAIISPKKCINCGQCMDACTNLGLQAKGSTIIDKDNYEKKENREREYNFAINLICNIRSSYADRMYG